MPYITEELYANIAKREKGDDLLRSQWPQYATDAVKKDAADEIAWVQKIISEIRSVRSDMNVPAGAKIALLVQGANDTTKKRLATYDAIIKQMARLATIDMAGDKPPAQAIKTIVEEATLILPIADLIDLDKERERLQKQISKLEDDIRKTDDKLNNQQFVDRAPPEILEEFRTRKAEALEVIQKLSTALQQLAAA